MARYRWPSYLRLAIFVLIVLGGVSCLIRILFFAFAAAIREPFRIAFTTANSEVALPKAFATGRAYTAA